METESTGQFVKTAVAGETVWAFVPDRLPPRLTRESLDGLAPQLGEAEAALERLELAGAMIPSLDWFVYAFVRKEALLSSEIEGTQATLIDVLSFEQTDQSGASNVDDIEEVTNIALLLTHWNLLDSPLLYFSLYLKQHQAEYYRWLGAVRTEGDWTGWLRFFLTGVSQVADTATSTARQLYSQVSKDRHSLLHTQGTTVKAIQLFELLPRHPVVKTSLVTRLLSTSKPTATKAIAALVRAGILAEIGTRKRDKVFQYSAYLRLLE